jgi:hypothetical protein
MYCNIEQNMVLCTFAHTYVHTAKARFSKYKVHCIGRKEQEVYFISSHVGILHNEQLTLTA